MNGVDGFDGVDGVDGVDGFRGSGVLGDPRGLERELTAAEPLLPGLALALDDALLRAWARGHGVPLPGTARVDRLRCKPGTSVRAAVDPGDGGPWWLLSAYAPRPGRQPHEPGKVDRDARAARGDGPTALDGALRAALVPAVADRDLPGLRPLAAAGARTLAHNPARRAVLRCGAELVKVHAAPGPAARAAVAAHLFRAAGTRTPRTVLRGELTAVQEFTGGGPAGEVGAALSALLGRWAQHAGAGLPALGPAALDAAVRAVLHRPGPLPPAARTDVEACRRRWGAAVPRHRAALSPRVLCHGDLSPDQLLRAPDGELVVLDLDRAARGPAGWDAATWRASCAALGRPPGAVPAAHPLLLAAAALLRLPEPFRRRRAGWPERTAHLAALAAGALDELAPRGGRG
ncbi:phosphotransferase family protein [Kineococcus sp. SYSU DK005]|uniref:phosphotransferase family protein n=1 Tax=Kineococcus sp. SYSU DK005 TaxID=3383126 RepID=UPI003D7CF038